jgi:hypothetical protein
MTCASGKKARQAEPFHKICAYLAMYPPILIIKKYYKARMAYGSRAIKMSLLPTS